MKKNYTISISVEKFWKVIVPSALILCIMGIFIGIMIVDHFVMPNIVGVNRDMVVVPGITGMSYEQARQRFFQVGLLTEIRGREYDDKVPADAVISQLPETGSKVKKGRKIAVTVSKGKEIGVIPDVRNLSERQARIELKKHGFSIGKVKKVYNDEKPIDVVVDAFPQSGTTISREIEVDLIISKGTKPTSAEAPNLVGESLTEAKKRIEESGLKLGSINYQNNKSLLPGTIVSQSVAPGANVPLESSIDIVVSVIR